MHEQSAPASNVKALHKDYSMALTYIETVRLLMGDLDAGDNNFFTADQWIHLFAALSYEDDNGDSKVNLVEVALDTLRIFSIYHADSRPERSKKFDDRVDAISRWPNERKGVYLVDGSNAPDFAPQTGIDIHNDDPDSHDAARARAEAAFTAAGLAHNQANIADAAADAAQAGIDAHEANHPTPDVSGQITTHDNAAPAHGAIRAKAQTTEDGLESHIAAHPGGVIAGPPGDGTVSRDKLTPALRADVDAHADEAALAAHIAMPHGEALWAAEANVYDSSGPLLSLFPTNADFNPVWGEIVLFVSPDNYDDNREQLLVRFGTGAHRPRMQDRDGMPVAAIQLVSGRIYIGYVTRNPPGGTGTALRISEALEQPSPVPTVNTYYWFLVDADRDVLPPTPTQAQILAGTATTVPSIVVNIPTDGTYSRNDAFVWIFSPHEFSTLTLNTDTFNQLPYGTAVEVQVNGEIPTTDTGPPSQLYTGGNDVTLHYGA